MEFIQPGPIVANPIRKKVATNKLHLGLNLVLESGALLSG
jgi:hypothetical protein